MAVIKVENNKYATVEAMYQWDKNQFLHIEGLSLPSVPEIHFVNEAMSRALVRQANMDSDGVIHVKVPESLLQSPYKITAYVCIYAGESFVTMYRIDIPVKARKRPEGYTFEDTDLEIYSFEELENLVNNTVYSFQLQTEAYKNEVKTYCDGQISLWEDRIVLAESNSSKALEAAEVNQKNIETMTNNIKNMGIDIVGLKKLGQIEEILTVGTPSIDYNVEQTEAKMAIKFTNGLLIETGCQVCRYVVNGNILEHVGDLLVGFKGIPFGQLFTRVGGGSSAFTLDMVGCGWFNETQVNTTIHKASGGFNSQSIYKCYYLGIGFWK